jgi:hypothetical protein
LILALQLHLPGAAGQATAGERRRELDQLELRYVQAGFEHDAMLARRIPRNVRAIQPQRRDDLAQLAVQLAPSEQEFRIAARLQRLLP